METPKERQQRRDELKSELVSIELAEMYQRIYGTLEGKEALRHLIFRGHFFESTCQNSGWTNFYEGERNFVLSMLSVAPGLFGAVLHEMCDDMQSEIDQKRAELFRQLKTQDD